MKGKVKRITSGAGSGHQEWGAIVSCSTDDGDQTTFYAIGASAEDALREIFPLIDKRKGRWYIDAISTPQTVYQDVTGQSRGNRGTFYRERQWLSRLERLDLLREPRLHRDTRVKLGTKGDGWRKLHGGRFLPRKRKREGS